VLEFNEKHSVIQHLLNRRGKTVPVEDGRKIALVNFGGVMAGIRGAGAMIALEDLGLASAFDIMYVNSAGLANVSYLLAGSTRPGTSIYYDDLQGHRFINFFKFWNIVNIRYLIRVMQERKVLDVARILSCHTQVWAAARQPGSKNIEYINMKKLHTSEYFNVMRAVTALPFLHPGNVNIQGKRYQDIYPYSPPHLQRALTDGVTDVLVICNLIEQIREVPNDPHVYVIAPDSIWEFSRFYTKPEALKREARRMGRLVKESFGVMEDIKLEY
jgi:predicted patatin/cPLA2 family phospholipase